MITFKSLRFFAPDGDAGGGAAVLDPPPAGEAPLPPIGKSYTEALVKQRGEVEPAGPTGVKVPDGFPDTGASGATGVAAPLRPDAEKAASGVTGVVAPPKPTSALDAALGAAVTGATGVTDVQPESFLKDLPETLPNENRKDHWKNARGAIEKLETRDAEHTKTTAELRKQLEAAKATPPESSARVTELEKENADLRDAIVGINVEFSPDHRKKFIEGRADLVGKAAGKAHAFGGNADRLKEAMEMSEGKGRSAAIKEALEPIEDEYDRARVMDLLKDVAKLDDEKADVMKDPQGAWKKLQDAETVRATEQATKREEFKQKTFDKVAAELPKTHFLLRQVDPALPGAEDHNAGVKAMQDAARAVLAPNANPEDQIKAAFALQELPKLQEHLVKARTDLATALLALQEFEGATPGFKGGKQPDKTPTEQQLSKSPGQLYQESLDAQKARA